MDEIQDGYDILDLGSFHNGYQGTFLAMSVLVGDNSVQLAIGQRCLVYAHVRTNVPGVDKVIASMFTGAVFYPNSVVAQVIFVGTLEVVTFDVVRFLERSSSYWGRVQQLLLKKPQTLVRCGCR